MATAAVSWGLSSAPSKIALVEQIGAIDLLTIAAGAGAPVPISPAAARAARGARHFLQENLPTEVSAASASFCLETAA